MNLRKQMWGSLRNDAAVTYFYSLSLSLVVSGGRGALGLGLGADRGTSRLHTVLLRLGPVSAAP